MATYNDFSQIIKIAGGNGFRDFLAKDYDLRAGIDIAKRP